MRVMPWYSPISKELERIDSIIAESLSTDNAELSEMCGRMISSGGKKIRPAVCILSHLACGGDGSVMNIAAAFEIIHNATLIHDDINDKSEIRRGRKTLHEEYTVTKAIVTGDLMFAVGFKLAGTCDPKVIDTLVNASVAMADSEFIQKDLEHIPSVTEDDYMRIIRGKTAMPIMSGAKVGAMMANASSNAAEAIERYAMNVGLAFQIIDDILDVTGDPEQTGKRVGTDIMEGKPTMPTILAMRDPSKGKRLKEIFSSTCISHNDVDEALKIINGTDAVEKCRRKAEELADAARSSLSAIPDSVYRTAMEALADYVVKRDR